jgi:hypothetical protein
VTVPSDRLVWISAKSAMAGKGRLLLCPGTQAALDSKQSSPHSPFRGMLVRMKRPLVAPSDATGQDWPSAVTVNGGCATLDVSTRGGYFRDQSTDLHWRARYGGVEP